MKKLLFRVLFGLMAFSIMMPAQTVLASTKKEKVSIKTNIYCDHCNQCESCGQRIYNALHEVSGVKKVKIDAKTQTISVTFDSKKTSLEEIEKVITANGFDANEKMADPEAYQKLDACCKK